MRSPGEPSGFFVYRFPSTATYFLESVVFMFSKSQASVISTSSLPCSIRDFIPTSPSNNKIEINLDKESVTVSYYDIFRNEIESNVYADKYPNKISYEELIDVMNDDQYAISLLFY